MRQGRHGIKVLGLSLIAALGLMAFAASAQAGEYTINEGGVHKTFTEHGIASESVEGTVAHGTLLVPGLGLTILCTGGTFSGTVLLGGTAHASILFSGCEGIPNGTVCKPFETKAKMETNLTADKGFIAASGLGQIILHEGKHYLLVENTTEFTTIYWPKLCALTLENVVKGSYVFELPTALELGLVNQTIVPLLQEVIEKLFPKDLLSYSNQPAWLHPGTATAHLSGALKGKFWGAK
jgi:hypothetical protein